MIRILETKDYIVDYDESQDKYRVSIFENNHFKDEFWFDAYKKPKEFEVRGWNHTDGSPLREMLFFGVEEGGERMTDAEVLRALEEMAAESEDNFSGKILNLIQRHQKEIERLQFVNLRDNARWKEKDEKSLNSIGILWDLYDEKCKQLERIVEQLDEARTTKDGLKLEFISVAKAIGIVKGVQNE